MAKKEPDRKGGLPGSGLYAQILVRSRARGPASRIGSALAAWRAGTDLARSVVEVADDVLDKPRSP